MPQKKLFGGRQAKINYYTKKKVAERLRLATAKNTQKM